MIATCWPAIRSSASLIVTFNERDFPASALAAFDIKTQHSDEFIQDLLDLDTSAVVAAARKQRASLKNPPLDVERFSRRCSSKVFLKR